MKKSNVIKFIQAYENMTCLRYGLKPYHKVKNINIISYDINELDYIQSVIYDFVYNPDSKYVDKITVNMYGELKHESVLRSEII